MDEDWECPHCGNLHDVDESSVCDACCMPGCIDCVQPLCGDCQAEEDEYEGEDD